MCVYMNQQAALAASRHHTCRRWSSGGGGGVATPSPGCSAAARLGLGQRLRLGAGLHVQALRGVHARQHARALLAHLKGASAQQLLQPPGRLQAPHSSMVRSAPELVQPCAVPESMVAFATTD